MYKCETIIYCSEEDQAFIAEFPKLSGCLAHGAIQEETLASIKDPVSFG